MARDFTKNTASYMSLGVNQIGPLIHGASQVSVHCLINFDTASTSSNARNVILQIPINGSANGIVLNIDAFTTPGSNRLRVVSRSQTADSGQVIIGVVNMSAGSWHSVGAVLNISGDTFTPYVDGAADSGGAVTYGATTYTNGTPTATDAIGGPSTPPSQTTDQLDGRVAELAIWAGDIGAAGFFQLNKRFSALFVRPELLVSYIPLLGRYSPEIDLMSNVLGTITGTVAQADHPLIYMPGAPSAIYVPSAVISQAARSMHQFSLRRV